MCAYFSSPWWVGRSRGGTGAGWGRGCHEVKRGQACARSRAGSFWCWRWHSLAACSDFSLFGEKEPPPDEPADQLYNQGVFLLNEKKDYKEAAKKFDEVDRQHPYSEWARKSLIMSAYAYYEAGSTTTASTPRSATSRLHPGSADAAYAQYLIGSSYFDQIPDITRDQEPHREGHRGARGGHPQISRLRICR